MKEEKEGDEMTLTTDRSIYDRFLLLRGPFRLLIK